MRGHRGWSLIAACVATAAARPAVAQGQKVDPGSLDGNWVRAGRNYDPHDEMRIRVGGGEATLTRVPRGAHPSFRLGVTIWMGIQPDGAVQVFGSNGRYYPGRITLNGDSLTLAVDESARGNDQVWRRAGPIVDGAWVRIAPGDPAADGMKVMAAQDQATVRFLPSGAPRVLRIGSRIWSEIGAGGSMQTMGSDGRYQPATIRLEGEDRLWVERSGLTAELWVRPEVVESVRASVRTPRD